MKRLARELPEPRQVRVDGCVIEPIVTLHERLHVIVLHVDDQEAERRQIARRHRNQRRAEAQQVQQAPGQQGARAAEGHERVVARVEPALDADLSDRVRLVPRGDFENSLGGPQRIETDRVSDPREPALGGVAIERDLTAEEPRRNAAEGQVRVGRRRLVPAPAIAHRAGIGARAARPDLERAVPRDPRDAAAAAPDGDDVDHRHLDRESAHGALGGELGRAAFDQAHVGTGTADVRREHALDARGGRDGARPERAGRGAAEHRRDRVACDLVRGDHAAIRLHHVERGGGSELVIELLLNRADVDGDARLHERVDQRRDRALVLTVFRQDLGRDRHVRRGMLALEHRAHAPLVLGIRVRVDEADADVRDPVPHEPPRDLDGHRLVERAHDAARDVESLRHLAHVMERHDPLRLHPEIGIAVALRDRLPRDLEDVTEPLRGDETESRELLVKQRVGCDGRAVRDGRHGSAAGEVEDLADPCRHADRRVVHGRRGLRRDDLAGRLVQRDDVGEGAPGVDADAERALHAGESLPGTSDGARPALLCVSQCLEHARSSGSTSCRPRRRRKSSSGPVRSSVTAIPCSASRTRSRSVATST